MDGEVRPETPEIFKNQKPEARAMLSLNPNKFEILTHIECAYIQKLLVAQIDEDDPLSTDEKIDLPNLYSKARTTVECLVNSMVMPNAD